jgi:hypothetical protein
MCVVLSFLAKKNLQVASDIQKLDSMSFWFPEDEIVEGICQGFDCSHVAGGGWYGSSGAVINRCADGDSA